MVDMLPESLVYVTGSGSPMILIPATVISASTVISIYFWFTQPGKIMQYLTSAGMYFLGIQQKFVRVGDLTLSYGERGSHRAGTPSIFFIHGFSADKSMYLPLVMLLAKDDHIVLLDLPGHGLSDIPHEDLDLTLAGFGTIIKTFVDNIQLNTEPFHIIGTSLGGAIAASYSSEYPQDVAKTTLVCPAMLTPEQTDFQKEVQEGKCLLLGNTADEVGVIMKKCLYNTNLIHRNKQVLKGIAQQRERGKAFLDRVFAIYLDMMHKEQQLFMDHVIPTIKSPTQVIWGRHDQLIHVSGAEELKKNLKNCARVDVLERCGHVVSVDRPKKMAKVLKEFIKLKV